ncbi:putative methyltransferase PA5071 [Chitinispirillum alkaliphilum]|nr:putative methyltransferase PA5071 [Chitinispirillum alkaliphilum]
MNHILLFNDDYYSESRVVIRDSYRLKHITQVLKAKTDSILKVGKLNGKLGRGRVICLEENECHMETLLSDDPPPALPCTLIVALPRPKSLKKVIEAATVMGVKEMYIIKSWRVDKSYWSTPVLQESHLNSLMYKALEQAVDTAVPKIHIRRQFRPFAEDELPGIAESKTAYIAHPYDSLPAPSKLRSPAVLIIGPEGGFIPFEIELMKKQGCSVISMGSRIMRVEHAVCAFLGKMF